MSILDCGMVEYGLNGGCMYGYHNVLCCDLKDRIVSCHGGDLDSGSNMVDVVGNRNPTCFVNKR